MSNDRHASILPPSPILPVDASPAPPAAVDQPPLVQMLPIAQMTTAVFPDMYIPKPFLFFIQRGSKHVQDAAGVETVGQEGDLFIFSPGASVTMQNRPVRHGDYRAIGVQFAQSLVDQVFDDTPPLRTLPQAQILRADPHRPFDILARIKEILAQDDLPQPVFHHRLLEPLIWLRALGVRLPTRIEETSVAQLRRLLQTDLSHPWRSQEVARHFGMSEATFRRWLAPSGQVFSKLLLQTRLEHGLGLLQTTDLQIVQIALDCGFKTQSHFSDTFRKRFGITPKEIRQVGG